MAVYAMGDVHGHRAAAERLLARAGFDPARDRLWLVGDLVNRGPDSAGAVRWARDVSDVCVLGNHDLALLAVAEGVREPRPEDDFAAFLAEPDARELLDWLRARPVLHREGELVLVHAGLLPQWTTRDAERWARDCEAALRGPARAALLDELLSPRRSGLAAALGAFANLRACTAEGEPCRGFTGPPDEAPPGCLPWFSVPGRKSADATVVFGHWAALGLRVEPRVIALDSGCAWGRALSMIRLDDRAVFQEIS